MAIIKLTIKPDTHEIPEAVKYIKQQLESIGNVKIKVESGSVQGVQGVAKSFDAVTTAVQQATSANQAWYRQVEKFDKDGNPVSTLREYADALGVVRQELEKNDETTRTMITDYAKAGQQIAQVERQNEAALDEVRKKQQQTWKAFLKEQAEYQKKQEQLEYDRIDRELKAEAAAEANRRRGIAAVDAWVEEYNRSMQRAENSAVSLDRQFGNLTRTLNNAKKQYPAGTFDELERQIREAWDALRGLDSTSESYIEDVDALQRRLAELNAQFSRQRAETEKVNKVTESLWMNIQKFARWYLIGNVYTKILNQLREALATMKEVDKELADIQKVTDRTNAEMEKLGDSAYRVASAYGIQASEYLESVAAFAKAGYGDAAEGLAELATKTQLVGDTSAEVANKFLIAADAAWKMGGNVTTLSGVLDKANTIENNYATTIDKLAQGFPIVSAVAAQAGMSVEETMAALGTITSVTQESGTKAATALRALILNIIGAVGEYEDGIEVTEESVKSLDGLLQIYAKDALKAAKAAGTVVNPLEAIAALAKASEEGLLNQAELFEVLSSLGGKLRTNQLTALVQNFDMFNEMLGKTAQSAGSADKEISILLDTWEAKTNILKNTWTDFVQKSLGTGFIKGTLDAANAVLKFADNAGLAAAAILGIYTVVRGKRIADEFNELKKTFQNVGQAIKGAGDSFTATTTVIGASITVLALAVMTIRRVQEARREAMKTAAEEAGTLREVIEQYDDLKERLGDESASRETLNELISSSTTKYDEEAAAQKSVNELREYGIQLIDEEARARAQAYIRENEGQYRRASRFLSSGNAVNMDYGGITQSMSAADALAFYERELDRARGIENPSALQVRAIETLSKAYADLKEQVDDAEAVISGYNTALSILNGTYEPAVKKTVALAGNIDSTTNSASGLHAKLKAVSQAADDMDEAIGGVTEALSKYGENSVQVYDAMAKLEKTIPGATDGLYDFETAAWKVEAAEYADKTALLDFIDSAKQAKLQPLIDEMERASAAALALAGSIALAMPGGYNEQFLEPYRTNPTLDKLKAEKASWDSWIANLRQRSDYKSADTSTTTTGRTSTGSSTDPELARRQGILELRKAELAFLQASGASQDKIVAKQKEIQSALHDVAERMREISGDTADTVALSTDWWNAEKAILEIQQEIFDTLKGIIDEYYDAAVTDKEKELSLEEKILEVQKAQVALENAQNERTVRYYNAATGQWERTANRQNVKAAQDALAKAQDDLNKYQKEQAWAEFKTAWEYVADQIKAGAMTFAEAYDYMYAKMKDIQDKYDYDMGMVLEDSIGGFRGLNVTIKDFTGDMAKELTDAVGTLKAKLDEFTTAIDAFKGAFNDVREKLASGELTSFEDAYQLLYNRALELDRLYGTGMAGALQNAIAGMDRTSLTIDELWKQVVVTLMRANSVNWYGADAATQAYLHAQNEALAKTIGATYDPSGYWSLGGQHLYDPNAEGGGSTASAGPNPSVSYTPTSSGSGSGAGMPDTVYVGGVPFGVSGGRVNNTAGFMEGTIFTDSSGRQWRMDAGGYLSLYSAYDSGGVLRGMGGIKATARDELVLPPDVTAKMLDPVNNEYSLRAIDDLRWMFGLRDRPRGISDVRSLTQNNGATYNFGGITLTEEQARRTTVYEFAQLARGLGSYSHRAV